MDCSPPGSTVHEIFQARILEWVAISFSRGSSQRRVRTQVSYTAGRFFTDWTIREAHWKVKVKVTQSCSILCNPMDYTVHGILQARILEFVAVPFSRGSSHSRDRSQVSHVAGGFFTSWATREAQEYWSGQPIPSPVDLPDSGIDPGSPALQADSSPAELSGKPYEHYSCLFSILWGIYWEVYSAGSCVNSTLLLLLF